MKQIRYWGALLIAGLVAGGSVTLAHDAFADGKKKEAAVAGEPPMTVRPINLSFPGISFGMSPERVATAIDAMIDADYTPKYKDASPGVQMKALDAQVSEEKAAFRRSRIDFGKIPTALDSSPLRGEFTYNNRETMMSLLRNGENVYFFFIQDRLWKIIGEHKLSASSQYGKDYTSSAAKFSSMYGVAGRVLPADYQVRFANEVDWRDANNHLRLIQRSDTAVGVALEDVGTWQTIATLRPNKPVQDPGIDPAVAAIMRHNDAPPGPPDPKAKKPAPKK